MRKKLTKKKGYYTNAKSRKKRVRFWNIVAMLVVIFVLALAMMSLWDRTLEVTEVKAEMMWFSGGELEFNLTTDRGYVKHELWKAGLLDEWEFVERLINAESRWDVWAIGVNDNPTIDRGLWMINSYWHREVSNECAFNLECSTKEAIRIRLESGNWNQWLALKQ
jgi:hypothetical protein